MGSGGVLGAGRAAPGAKLQPGSVPVVDSKQSKTQEEKAHGSD